MKLSIILCCTNCNYLKHEGEKNFGVYFEAKLLIAAQSSNTVVASENAQNRWYSLKTWNIYSWGKIPGINQIGKQFIFLSFWFHYFFHLHLFNTGLSLLYNTAMQKKKKKEMSLSWVFRLPHSSPVWETCMGWAASWSICLLAFNKHFRQDAPYVGSSR